MFYRNFFKMKCAYFSSYFLMRFSKNSFAFLPFSSYEFQTFDLEIKNKKCLSLNIIKYHSENYLS